MALSKETLERLIARSTDIVVATDRHGIVVYYNDGASRSLGYAPEEILGNFVGQLYPDLDRGEARDDGDARSRPLAARAIVETFQTTFLSKTGEQIPVAISGTILYDERRQGRRHDRLREGPARDPAQGQARDAGRGGGRPLARDQQPARGDPEPGRAARARHRRASRATRTARSRSSASIACAARSRASRRSSNGSPRWRESEQVETIDYVGPARMIDLRRRCAGAHARPAARGRARAGRRRRRRHLSQPGRDPGGRGLLGRDGVRRRRCAREARSRPLRRGAHRRRDAARWTATSSSARSASASRGSRC